VDYRSPLWAGSPASQLAHLSTVKPRLSRSLESFVMKLHLWADHIAVAKRSVGSLVFFHLISGLASSALSVHCLPPPPPLPLPTCQVSAGDTFGPPATPPGETTEIQDHCSPSLIFSCFFPHLWNHLPLTNQCHSSLSVFKTAVHSHPPSKIMIFSATVKLPLTLPKILLMHPSCPPFVFSLIPHHYLYLLYVHLVSIYFLPPCCCWCFPFVSRFIPRQNSLEVSVWTLRPSCQPLPPTRGMQMNFQVHRDAPNMPQPQSQSSTGEFIEHDTPRSVYLI